MHANLKFLWPHIRRRPGQATKSSEGQEEEEEEQQQEQQQEEQEQEDRIAGFDDGDDPGTSEGPLADKPKPSRRADKPKPSTKPTSTVTRHPTTPPPADVFDNADLIDADDPVAATAVWCHKTMLKINEANTLEYMKMRKEVFELLNKYQEELQPSTTQTVTATPVKFTLSRGKVPTMVPTVGKKMTFTAPTVPDAQYYPDPTFFQVPAAEP